MGISSLRTASFAMRNWASALGRILFKFCTAISTKSGCRDPVGVACPPTPPPEYHTLGPNVPITGYQWPEAVLLASQDDWLITGSFSTTGCQTVHSVTQKSGPLQHTVLWKENKVYQVPLFILSSHLFFCILLAFQHVLECAAGNGSKSKGQRLPLDAGIHYCWVSYTMPKWVTPIMVWYPRAGTEPEDLDSGNARLTAEQEDSSEIHRVGLREMDGNITRYKKG